MLVNVITRHAPANYGSLLQTIATQKVIMKLGYECKIIDYIPKCETGTRVAFTQLTGKKEWNKNLLKKAVYLVGRESENMIMYKKFSSMRKKYLSMGARYSSNEELKQAYANETGSIFFTGSDQVWGPISTGTYDSAYFLDFAPIKARKYAFAASFGKKIFDESTMAEYKKYLKKYNRIAVRENSAVDILKKMGISSEQVLDPTLLVSAEEWSTFIDSIKKPVKYVLVYQIHNNPELDKYASKFAKKACLPLIRVSPLLHQAIRSGKFVYLPDISVFLDLIKNATYLVTDSFHGTAFAINFNTQFVEILPNTGTSSRNQSILELTGLNNRILRDLDEFCYIDEIIDFSEANRIISQKRVEGIQFLKQCICE